MLKGVIAMSLLRDYTSNQAKEIARLVFDEHFKFDAKLKSEMDERRQSAMYQDILYNLSYLEISIKLEDAFIFQDYAQWIYELLCNLMPDLSRERIAQQMIDHYRILGEVIQRYPEIKTADQMVALLKQAELTTKAMIDAPQQVSTLVTGEWSEVRAQYLDRLLQNDTRGAIRTILEAVQSGVKIQDVYLNVFKDVMYEVGRLWHQNKISVDKEHYCTSVTQMAIAQFYTDIFSQPRINRKVLATCVGSELHEMGIRMISDLFEYHGWDSTYLGASVPLKDMMSAIKEHQPELICLSVTMPHHLELCHQMIQTIRTQFPHIRIAVGGQAFTRSADLLTKWNVDFKGDDVSKLIHWATYKQRSLS